MRMRNPGKYLLAGCVVTSVLVAAPLALGAGEGRPLDGGARNPSQQLVAGVHAGDADHRQRLDLRHAPVQQVRRRRWSDLRLSCDAARRRTRACARRTSPTARRSRSTSNGGNQVGSITSANKNAAPFTTNATGVATGLNADQVDGQSASQIQTAASTAAVTSANKFAVINGATAGSPRAAASPSVRAHHDRRLHGDRGRDHQRVRLRSDAAERDAGDRRRSSRVDATHLQVADVRGRRDAGVPAAADTNVHLTITC